MPWSHPLKNYDLNVTRLLKVEPSRSIGKHAYLENKLEKEPHTKAFTIPKLH
jgi:hypothetical protein